MSDFISDSPLARDLIRIGDEAIVREDKAKLRDYFAADYVFHGPYGDLTFDQLSAYFASLRAAFSELRIDRDQVIVDGNFVASRTRFAGDFTDVFTHSPIGSVDPTGEHIEWEVINTFRYAEDGRLAEEWVQTDYRGFLTKLGVKSTETAREGNQTQIVRALISQFFNAHDPEVAATYFTEDFWWTGGSVGTIEGRDEYQSVMRQFWTALPDARATEQEIWETGDTVIARFQVAGTHSADLWGIPPTGTHVEWQALMIYKFRDGKIAQQWAAEDWTAILTQIGDITPPWMRS
jgi:predicted ester cyclase